MLQNFLDDIGPVLLDNTDDFHRGTGDGGKTIIYLIYSSLPSISPRQSPPTLRRR
jgi:hypothetical protein